jgi:hypothetical protein
MEAIFLISPLMERNREQKKDLHMIFIDMEKAYDKVHRNVMWWALQKHKISTKYIALIKHIYDNVVKRGVPHPRSRHPAYHQPHVGAYPL